MKILFTLTPAFNPNAGGVQRTTWKLGQYFSEQGLEVFYYSLAHEGHTEPAYGKLHSAPAAGGAKVPENIKNLESLLIRLKPDVVINQMPYEKTLRECLYHTQKRAGYLLLGCLRNSLFSFKSNARHRMRQMLPQLVFTFMNHTVGEAIVQGRHWYTHRRDLKAIIDQHDYFVLLTPPNREELQYFVGDYKAGKVIAIPNSIPSVAEKLPPKEKIILHVGRINVQQKRSDLLLDFWAQTCEHLPDWKFLIVGDGPYMQQLRKELKQRNLPRVQLEGYQKPEPYYEKAAIFMMPSAYEGFPNTLLEAQSYGCAPLLFNSYAALDWIAEDKKNALLIPPFDTAAMAEKAIRLAQDAASLRSIQQAALQNARRFTIDRVGQMWIDLFRKQRIL
jgi:glycosyltransferase involved in cell wall biosynthesis